MVQMKQLFGTIARSTSAPAGYDQIDDTSEGRLKVHAEEAFKAGIKFKARFIGSLEIPKVRAIHCGPIIVRIFLMNITMVVCSKNMAFMVTFF